MTDRELMQQALEALTAYDGTNGASQRKRVLAALRERLAQPNEFEPDWDQVEALQESLREHMAEIQRLRQWQGLTEDDVKAPIQRAMQHFGYDPTQYGLGGMATIGFLGLVKEIEAKLREKNT